MCSHYFLLSPCTHKKREDRVDQEAEEKSNQIYNETGHSKQPYCNCACQFVCPPAKYSVLRLLQKLWCFCSVLTRGAKRVVLTIAEYEVAVHASLCFVFSEKMRGNARRQRTSYVICIQTQQQTEWQTTEQADDLPDRTVVCQTFTMYRVCYYCC